jgi:hypothetical protein
MQHEITSSSPLLDENGNIAEPGYAKKLLPVYRRADIKAPAVRIKEWDYYLINNGRFALALTVDDNGYMSLDSISLLNFDEKWEITKSPMSASCRLGRVHLPETSAVGDVQTLPARPLFLYFKNDGSGVRELSGPNGRIRPSGRTFRQDNAHAFRGARGEHGHRHALR